MPALSATLENGFLIIKIKANLEPELSKSGKSRLVATSKGNQETDLTVKGKPVVVGLNAYIEA